MRLDFQLNLSYHFSESKPGNDGPRWLRTWAIIGRIKLLQNLWVRISWSRLNLSAAEEKVMLEPLWIVGRPKVYDLSLPLA